MEFIVWRFVRKLIENEWKIWCNGTEKIVQFVRIYVDKMWNKYLNEAIETPATSVNMLEPMRPAELQPSLLLHWQYSMKMLNVPVLIKQNRSSPTIPGSPMKAQLLK